MDINPQLTELKTIVLDLSKDMSYIKGELSQMNERLQSLESRMEGRMIALEGRMSTLEGRMTDLFKWMVGMMIPVWIGILGAIIVQLIK